MERCHDGMTFELRCSANAPSTSEGLKIAMNAERRTTTGAQMVVSRRCWCGVLRGRTQLKGDCGIQNQFQLAAAMQIEAAPMATPSLNDS
jgi:hypothetical protein